VPTRPFTANIVEFQSPTMPLTAATTSVNLLTIFDSGQSQITFTVRRPTVDFASTSLSTADPTVTVKGTLTGYGKVENIELGGNAGTVSTEADDAFQFVIPNVAVNPGKNMLEGSITSIDGVVHPFSVVVERRPRLSFDFVRRAIHTLSRARLTELLDEYGVDFQLDEETTQALRAAGADQNLLDAIRDAAP